MLFWGVSFVATRAALDTFHPLSLIATRLWLGAGLLVLIQKLRGRPIVPERRDLGRCLVLGLVNAVHLGLQAYGLLHTSAIRTGWIIAVIPVSIALGGQLFLGKRLTRMGWLGALVAMAGVFGVTMKEPPDLANARFGDRRRRDAGGVEDDQRGAAGRRVNRRLAVTPLFLILSFTLPRSPRMLLALAIRIATRSARGSPPEGTAWCAR
jgi:hypothetical protein